MIAHLARWVLRRELRALRLEAANARLKADNCELQLAVLRAMYATALREKDTTAAAFDHVAGELARIQQKRRREREAARTWITRAIRPRINEN